MKRAQVLLLLVLACSSLVYAESIAPESSLNEKATEPSSDPKEAVPSQSQGENIEIKTASTATDIVAPVLITTMIVICGAVALYLDRLTKRHRATNEEIALA